MELKGICSLLFLLSFTSIASSQSVESPSTGLGNRALFRPLLKRYPVIVSEKKPDISNEGESNKTFSSVAIVSPTRMPLGNTSLSSLSDSRSSSPEIATAEKSSPSTTFNSTKISGIPDSKNGSKQIELNAIHYENDADRPEPAEGRRVQDPTNGLRSSISCRSSLKRTKPSGAKKPYHVQSSSGNEVLIEKEVLRSLSNSKPEKFSSIPSAVLKYFIALGSTIPQSVEKDVGTFHATTINNSLATIATEMNAANMYEYLQHAEAVELKGLPLSMLMAKMIDLCRQEPCTSSALVPPKPSCFPFFRQQNKIAVAPVVPTVQLDVARIPESYRAQLAKLYFLMTGKGLDFNKESFEQPACSFSVAELYKWDRLPKEPQRIDGFRTLDLSPYRIDSLYGLQLLPYLRKIDLIRISPKKHFHFYFAKKKNGTEEVDSDDSNDAKEKVHFQNILFCRFSAEDSNEIYPPDHRFAHID